LLPSAEVVGSPSRSCGGNEQTLAVVQKRVVVQVAVVLLTGTCVAGCGDSEKTENSTTTTQEAVSEVRPPNIAKVLPPNYRVRKVWRASLTGQDVPETIVSSVGPPHGELQFHAATLQVLSWDDIAKRWIVIFDGQKVIAPDSFGSPMTSNSGPGNSFASTPDERKPILDPEADVVVDQVRFPSLLPDKRKQLVFSATINYGGSGVPSTLVVVDFPEAQARIAYAWSGEHLDWTMAGNQIAAKSSYWTRADAHCCPSRSYTFVVGNQNGSVTVLRDQRPYLGVLVRETGGGTAFTTPLEVVEVDANSPAASVLRVGDVLVDVENAPSRAESDPGASASIYNKVSAFDAGQVASLIVTRDEVQIRLRVRLGSLLDASGVFIPADDYTIGAL
jgi:hypothetical protein